MAFDLLTSKSIGRILDSWWVSVWSFMIIGWLQSQLSSGNHFQITMRHDLDLWPFDPKINRAHPWLMGSKCMKFHDHRWITESVIVRKLVWWTDRQTDRQTDWRTDRQTECKPIVPSGFTGGGLTRHVFVKHGCPRRQQSQNMAKISKSYILTPPHPQGCVMPVKCEEPMDEVTVQVWLLYHHPNFKYCTLFVSGKNYGRTDDPITRCPRRTFPAGGIITYQKSYWNMLI